MEALACGHVATGETTHPTKQETRLVRVGVHWVYPWGDVNCPTLLTLLRFLQELLHWHSGDDNWSGSAARRSVDHIADHLPIAEYDLAAAVVCDVRLVCDKHNRHTACVQCLQNG